MKTSFSFIDPSAIMGVVVTLIILAVGVFAFFVTINNIPNLNPTPGATTTAAQNQAYWEFYNHTLVGPGNTGNSVFNILGIVLIIGAIMSIVGLVYNYVK